MHKYIGANDSMKKSIGFFEHEGMFSIHLGKHLTKDIMRALLKALGCEGAGTIEQNSRDQFSFTGYLHNCMYVSEKASSGSYPNYEKIVYSRDAAALKNVASQCGYNDIVVACNRWMGLDDNDSIPIQSVMAVATENKKKLGKYDIVDDIISDEDNFGLIIMNLYLKLENIWEDSMKRFIELGIDIPIDQNTISQRKMKGKFYLESLKNIKLSDFLSNLDAIGCPLVKDIDAKLQELNSNVVRFKKASFSGKNEVASWCSDNGLSHLYDQLISLGFDSLAKLKQLDDQSCTEMGIKGFGRIELMKKINLLK